MASEVIRFNPDPVDPVPRQVWTFVVRGGSPFTLTMPNAPPLIHEGTSTLWKLPGTPEQVKTLREAVTALGASVEVFTEVQSLEQTIERVLTTGEPGPR